MGQAALLYANAVTWVNQRAQQCFASSALNAGASYMLANKSLIINLFIAILKK